MNRDKSQDKYNEVFQQMKEDTMPWDFEDFLKKAEAQETDAEEEGKSAPVIPISKGKKPSVPKGFWMAAGIALLITAGFGISRYYAPADLESQDALVQNRIRTQKDDILKDSGLAYQDVSDTLSGKKNHIIIEDSLSNEVSNPDKVMNQIVPKRGRIIRKPKERLAATSKQAAEYQENFVIVNGHKIKNEEEAINVTKYSFQMLSDNVAKTIASSVVQENPIEN